MKTYYHFTGDTLMDGRPIPKLGEWLEHTGNVIPCEAGLHASEHPFDALKYAPGNMLHLVELGGEVIPHGGDKVVARRRKIVKSINAEKLLRDFARRCALDVLHLWKDAPQIVVQYLKTGGETIRSAAWDAARAAAWSSAWSAAWSSAWDAARAAAWSSAWSAARSAAWSAARSSARSAATKKYRAWFAEMVADELCGSSVEK